MRKQRSPCTMSSQHLNLPERPASSPESGSAVDHWLRFNSFWSKFEGVDSDQRSNPYFHHLETDESAPRHAASPSIYPHSFASYQTPYRDQASNGIFVSNDSWNPAEPCPPFQYNDNSLDAPEENSTQYSQEDPFYPPILQCGVPTVTSYGAVTILLRHLIRVDVTCNGSVSVYNFPSMSITALSASGSKCYVQHPNGCVYQDGPDVHMVTVNSRYVKITHRGILFSPTPKGLAYLIDESGAKTSTAKFMELNKDLVMDVFYDGNSSSYDRLQEEGYRMAEGTRYQSYPNGSQSWVIGRIRIKQDKWGEVTVSQIIGDKRRTVMASPTVRRATVESPSLNVNIDCYSKNYFIVRADSCYVSSGYCGLIVQNRSQKAGIDRLGRLVLF